MLQTQPVLSSPKAHWPAQQLGTPSSQPWKAGLQERQLVTTTLGQGRSLFEELWNTAATENLGKKSLPFLATRTCQGRRPVLTPAQCQLLPTPWLPTALWASPFCLVHDRVQGTGTQKVCRWLSLDATEHRELQSPCTQVPWGYTPGVHSLGSQDGATVLTCPYAQFPSK